MNNYIGKLAIVGSCGQHYYGKIGSIKKHGKFTVVELNDAHMFVTGSIQKIYPNIKLSAQSIMLQ